MASHLPLHPRAVAYIIPSILNSADSLQFKAVAKDIRSIGLNLLSLSGDIKFLYSGCFVDESCLAGFMLVKGSMLSKDFWQEIEEAY